MKVPDYRITQCAVLARALFLALIIAVMPACRSMMGSVTRLTPDYASVPQEALSQAAKEIEAAVLAGNKEAQFSNIHGLVLNAPEITQAIRSRTVRASLIDDFRATGHAWEKKDGLLWIIRSSAYKNWGTRKDRDRNALLVNSENADRWIIYEEIMKENNLPPAALTAIQEVFQRARIEVLPSGEKFEDESGETTIK